MDATQQDRLHRIKDAQGIVGLSRSQILRLEAAGRFPRRVNISGRAFAYVGSELQQFIRDRIAERDAAKK